MKKKKELDALIGKDFKKICKEQENEEDRDSGFSTSKKCIFLTMKVKIVSPAWQK